MAKRKRAKLEDELAAIAALGQSPDSEATRRRLREALARGSSPVVARAARLVAEHRIEGLGEPLEVAFGRFLEDPVRTDPSCAAKVAILDALDLTDHPDPEPFRAGARHVQLEPAWGPPVDTAVGVRARSGLALARLGDRDVLLVLGELLADPEVPVRRSAVDALVLYGARDGAALLLHRLRAGDPELLVTADCMSGIVALTPDQASTCLCAPLTSPDATLREMAALALGDSRSDDTLDLLLEVLDETVLGDDRRPLITALGLHRSDRARTRLLSLVSEGSDADARLAIAALAVHRANPGVVEALRGAAEASEHDLTDALAVLDGRADG